MTNKEVIEILASAPKWDRKSNGAICMAIEALEAQDSNRWIPCSERLPEESGKYIVSGKWGSGKVEVGGCLYSVNDGYFDASWNFDVLAWMPLPEPYKE